MARPGDARFYDVSWLVSGTVVREWDCFCPSSPPPTTDTATATAAAGGSSSRRHNHDEATAMAPLKESFESLMPGLRHDDMWLFGSSKSYALRSSAFQPSHEACPVPTLWVDHQEPNDSILEWLKSPKRCTVSRLIIADTRPYIISSILDALKESWPSSSIRHLGFYSCSLTENDHWERLIDMLCSTKCPIRSLLCAHLQSPAGVLLLSLIRIAQDPDSNISELLIHGAPNGLMPRGSFKQLLRVLQNKVSTLRRLSLTSCHLQDEDVEEISLFLKSPCCKITAINLSANPFSDIALQSLRAAIIEGQRLSSEGKKTSSLEMLSLCGSSVHLRDKRVTNAITQVLEDPACGLEVLDLTGRSADAEWILDLAQILRKPSCKVRSLYLFHVSYLGSDHASADSRLIDALKVYKHISNLEFPWASEAYKQIADNLLQRNILWQSTGLVNEPLMPSQCTKIFLCGHEEAGKTTLSEHLLYSSKMKTVIGTVRGRVSERQITHGMKLSVLQLAGGSGHSTSAIICDLAGQREYHALHHVFLTSSNEDLFLVVCRYNEQPKKQVPDLTVFESRLDYWLRFIVSHRTSSHPKPTVVLVINFFNCTSIKQAQRLRTARIATEAAVSKYEDLLDFGRDACNVFGVKLNSLKPSKALPIKERVENLASGLIKRRNPIFKICGDIASAIKIIGKESSLKKADGTVITTLGELQRRYTDMCQQSHNYTIPSSDAAFEAALLELHKICQIVFFKSAAATRMREQVVILDPVWFYGTLVGCFVEPVVRPESSSSAQHHVARGAWKESEIKIQMWQHGQCQEEYIDGILSCLKMLDLFYVIEESPDGRLLLFPTILPDLEGSQAVDWHNGSNSSSGYLRFFGRRLKCKDTKRSLLPWGVFTRLQVQLYAVYGKTNKYRVGYGWITFAHEEVEAFIRFGGANSHTWEDRHWIDIMVRYSAGSASDGHGEWKAEAVISNARNIVLQICQGLDRGCGGITLEEWVILDKSTSEAVLLTKAKEQVYLQGIEADCDVHWFRGSTSMSHKAMSKIFLPSEVKEFSMQNTVAIRDLREEFALQDNEATAQLSAGERRLYEMFSANMRVEFGNLVHTVVEHLEKARESIYASVSEQLMQREEAISGRDMLPLCPYLMDIDGRWRKLSVMAQVKQARLHLMCESYKGCHKVEEQKGIPITISSPEWVAKVIPVLIPGLELVYGAARIGAAIFLPGVSAVMPETETLFSVLGLPKKISIQHHKEAFPQLLFSYAEGLPNLPQNFQALSGLPPLSLLREFYKFALEGHLKQVVMEKNFALHRVYFRSKARTSWVCAQHLQQGFQEEQAELLPTFNPFQLLA